MSNKKTSLIIGFLSVVFILIAIFPLAHSGYIRTHDTNLYPIWLYEFNKGISEGQWLPRWSNDFWLGLGAPLFNFIQPLFYYVSEFFHLLGLGLVDSIKAALILAFILGFGSMYLLSKLIWSSRLYGLVGAVIFTFFPYRLALVYIRGDYAEFLATSLIPLIIFSFIKLVQTKKLIYFLLSSLTVGLLLLSHNLQTLFALPLLFLILLIIYWPEFKKSFLPVLGAMALGGALAAFFALPAFLEKSYLNLTVLSTGKYDFHNYFLQLGDLFILKWDSAKYFQVGFTTVVVLLVTINILFNSRFQQTLNQLEKKYLYFFFFLIIVCFFLVFPFSAIFWENVPLVKFIQFPWRVLSFVGLAVAILSGFLLKKETPRLYFKKNINKKIVFSIIILTTIGFGVFFLKPVGYLKKGDDQSYFPLNRLFNDVYDLNGQPAEPNGKTVYNYYAIVPLILPKGVDLDKLSAQMNVIINQIVDNINNNKDASLQKIDIIEGNISWTMKNLKNNESSFDLIAEADSLIRVNQFWFPGWRAYLDGQEIKINHDNEFQIMTLAVPKGNHRLTLLFKNTPIRNFSEVVSGLALIVWLTLFGYGLVVFLIKKKTSASEVYKS